MSARDDYPPIPNGVNRPGGWGLLHLRMCDEIDQLRAQVYARSRCGECGGLLVSISARVCDDCGTRHG